MARYITILSAVIFTLALPAEATTYKWVDESGHVQYGDTMPAQYSNKAATELNGQGQVIKKREPGLTPEQIKAKEAEVAQKKEDEKQAALQKRKDLALTNTYTNEKEIDAARDRNLALVDATLKTAQARMIELQARIKKSPGNKDIEKEMQSLQKTISEKSAETKVITARFEADKQRYRELTTQPQAQAKKP